MKLFYKSTSVFCLSFLFSFLCVAQEGVPVESVKKKPGRTFQIACWSDWTKDELYIGNPKKKGGSQMTKVDILNMSYSQGYSYKIDQPLYFYRKTEDPENPFMMALKVAIPQTYKKPLLMLIIEKKKVRHILYDLDANKFPYGSYKVVNFTKVHLFADLGGKKFSIKPNQNHFVRLSHGKKTKAVQFRVAMKSNKKSKLIYSNMLMNRKNKRMLMFFYTTKDEADRTTIKCRSLVDFFVKKKKPS